MAHGHSLSSSSPHGSLNSRARPIRNYLTLTLSGFRRSQGPCDAQQAHTANLVCSLSLSLPKFGMEWQRRAHGQKAILSPHGYLAALVDRERITYNIPTYYVRRTQV